MKSIIVILLFAATTMVAQSTEQSPCAVYKQVIKSRNISALDSLIDAHASSSSLFDLKLLRAHAISKIYRIKIEHSDPEALALADEALADFAGAIEYQRAAGKDLSDYQIKRYLTFGKLLDYPQQADDQTLTEKYYYTDERQGLGANLVSLYNGDFWTGGELSVFQGQVSKEEQKNALGETIYKNNHHLTMTALSVGFVGNLSESPESLLLLNLVSLKSPFNIQPTQVVVLNIPTGNFIGYMPSLGFGYAGFSASYAYLTLFKQGVDFDNRHFLKLEWNYTFPYR